LDEESIARIFAINWFETLQEKIPLEYSRGIFFRSERSSSAGSEVVTTNGFIASPSALRAT
jgi:hypothetical protein